MYRCKSSSLISSSSVQSVGQCMIWLKDLTHLSHHCSPVARPLSHRSEPGCLNVWTKVDGYVEYHYIDSSERKDEWTLHGCSLPRFCKRFVAKDSYYQDLWLAMRPLMPVPTFAFSSAFGLLLAFMGRTVRLLTDKSVSVLTREFVLCPFRYLYVPFTSLPFVRVSLVYQVSSPKYDKRIY